MDAAGMGRRVEIAQPAMTRGGPINNRGAKRGRERKWGFTSCCHSGNTKNKKEQRRERGLPTRGGDGEDIASDACSR